jgi:sugar lactone lactonase YvrE
VWAEYVGGASNARQALLRARFKVRRRIRLVSRMQYDLSWIAAFAKFSNPRNRWQWICMFPSRAGRVSKNALSQQKSPDWIRGRTKMSKATAAVMSLFIVACVCVFAKWISFRPAAKGTRRQFLRYAAPGLLVLLAPALLWALFGTSFQGYVSVLSTGGITLSTPYGMAMDASGNLYISNGAQVGQVWKVTAAGVGSVVAFPGLSPALNSPWGMAVDGSGNLYVADSANHRVVELSAAGVASVVDTGSLLMQPYGVAVDAAGDLYISDTQLTYIVEVPAGGGTAVPLSISGVGTPLSYLSSPAGLGLDASGNLYIADAGNSRVVKVTPAAVGSVLTISGGITLNFPVGVTVDGLGTVYIADYNNNRIVTVTAAGAGGVVNTGGLTLSAPRSVVVTAFGAVYITDSNNNRVLEVEGTNVGLGHLPLQAGSGTTLTLPITIAYNQTFGSAQAFTQGAAGLDFTVASTTCVAGVTSNGACTVNITFLPTAAGLRKGAMVIYNDASPNVPILTVPIYGTGDAPLAALSPGTASLVSTAPLTTVQPFQVAFDGAGNMYVANYGNVAGNVVRVPAGGGTATVVSTGGFTLAGAIGVVLDGAGNLYISDHDNNRILEVTAGGVVSVLTITGLSTGLSLPTATAMDAAGNLYISDYGNGRIVVVTPSGAGSVLGTGSFTFPSVSVLGVAVDGAGTVYIPDSMGSRVVKVTAAGAASLVVPAGITPLLSSPQGVAVDAFGNLYIADAGNHRVVEVTTAGVASVLQMPGQSLVSEYGVTADASGNVFMPDFGANQIVTVNVAGATLAAFPNTDVGSASSPETATVTNLGDLPLAFTTNPTYTANFSEDTGDTNLCAISTSLSAGTACDVSVEFTPQSAGSLSAGIVVTNNSLNLTATTQSVAVSGTGVSVADTTAVAVSTNPTAANIGQPLAITAIVTDTAAGHTATVPTGGVTFMDTVGSTTISLNGGNPVTLNGSGQAILIGVALSGAGVHTITAIYPGVAGTFLASGAINTLLVSTDTAVIAGPATQPVQVVNGQAGSVPVTVTGPYSVSVVAAPTGSLSYNVLNSSSVSVASGTATLTAGSTDSSATVPLASSLAAGSYTVSLTYGGDGNYAAISTAVTIPVVVGPAVPTINWTGPAGGITYGATLSGVLNASAVSGSTPVAGTFTYTATPAGGSAVAVTGATLLAAGSYTLTATFTPASASTYASTSASASLTVAKATPALALTSSLAAAGVGSAVTFTATVTSSAGTPSGSVSFYDGTTLLGSGTLAGGVATYTTTNLPVGALSITAVYGGDSNFSTLTSSALTETVMTAFTVTAPTTPVTVAPGGAVTIDITVPPLGGAFNSVVTLSASGLPPGASATFNPPTVTPGTAGAPTVLTIQLAALAAGMFDPHRNFPYRQLPFAAFALTIGLFGAGCGRKRGSRMLKRALAFAVLAGAAATLLGCGGGFLGPPTTQPGSYVVTITGTSGSTQASTTVTVVVQ